MRISDWSSDVCSSDLLADEAGRQRNAGQRQQHRGQDRREIRTAPEQAAIIVDRIGIAFSHRTGTERDDAERADRGDDVGQQVSPDRLDRKRPAGDQRHHAITEMRDRRIRSEEHTSELQSLMRISYAVFSLKKNNNIYDPLN